MIKIITVKNDVLWDVTPCGSCKNRRFGGTYHLHHQGDKIDSVLRLQVTANVVSSSPIFVTLIMEAICSSETSVLTRATRRNIAEEDFLPSHRRENFKPKYYYCAYFLS
jgi:hypothetical protein